MALNALQETLEKKLQIEPSQNLTLVSLGRLGRTLLLLDLFTG
jgi:hypothetical protein